MRIQKLERYGLFAVRDKNVALCVDKIKKDEADNNRYMIYDRHGFIGDFLNNGQIELIGCSWEDFQ